MSASKEQKKQARTAREAQEQKEARRSNLLYGLIAVLFVAAAVATMVWKSNIVQRSATAATVNGVKATAPEVQYYYASILNQNQYYLSYMGVDATKDLRDQECNIDENTKTWFDYFAGQALDQMANIHTLSAKAEAEGLTWNSDMEATFQETMDSLQEQVDTYNSTRASKISTDDYLKLVYGSLMTRKAFESETKKEIQAQAYADQYRDSLTYDDAKLQEAYEASKDDYDRVDYESVKISGAAEPTKDADGKDVDPTDEEKAAAMKEAKKKADEMMASFKGGKTLKALADADDDATYTDGENASHADNVLSNWLFESARKRGDSAVLEDEDGEACYVVSFGKRYRPEDPTVDVRHILVSFEEGEKSEGDEGYEEEQAQLKADAKAKADELLAQYQSGEQKEDAFAALARSESDDGGSASSGGLIDGINKNSNYVDPFKNWALEKHEVGDTGIVESTYGYHIMYYVGNEEPEWKYNVTTDLTTDDFNEWYDATTEGGAHETLSGMKYVG